LPIRPRTPTRPKREGLWKHWTLWAWFAITAILSLGAVTLWKSGHWLVHEDAFENMPWAVILAGETRDCERTDEAIRLFKDGRIDSVMVSACRVFKTRYQSEFMLDYMISEGVPKGNIFEFRQDAYSTLEEARLLIRQFRFQNLDSVLIITSNYHSARTHYIFKKLSQGYPHILVYPAKFDTYNPASWWSNRESRKYWLDEWLKTFFTYYEVWRTGPERGKADYQALLPDIWTPVLGDSGTRSLTSFVESANSDTLSQSQTDSADTNQANPSWLIADSGKDSSLTQVRESVKVQDSTKSGQKSDSSVKAEVKNQSGLESRTELKTGSKSVSKPAAKNAAKQLEKPTAAKTQAKPSSAKPVKKVLEKQAEKSKKKSN
jgi:uncharacterized SAM-binding protein YcdF (DUF218 family)